MKEAKVTVIDACMGKGKTTYVIDLMRNSASYKKYIYITPLLKEVERIRKAVASQKFKVPEDRKGHGSKYEHFKQLIEEGANIVTTHALFKKVDERLLGLLKREDYTLIVDEVFEVINKVGFTKSDFDLLVDKGLIESEEYGRVVWKENPAYNGRFNDIKEMALAGTLYFVNDMAFAWNFPAKIFKAFEKVYLLTYMFDGQLQKYYYDFHGVSYVYKTIGDNGELVDYKDDKEERQKYRRLIDVYEGRMNEIGEREYDLSKSWYERNPNKLSKLKNNLVNFFININKAKSRQIMWTTFKDYMDALKGRGYTKSFTSCTLRATNDYDDRTVLAYTINRYLHPIPKAFFTERGIEVNEDLVALTDLLQWLFRSAVRKGEEVTLYIPSRRMRTLLTRWLEGEM